jgi:proteic killer suppression protein
MIQSFNCKDTQALYEGKSPRKFKAFLAVAERKLAQLEAAQTLEFLKSPPGNHLEALKGTERDNTAFASMISGEFALSGPAWALSTLKLWTTTRKIRHG